MSENEETEKGTLFLQAFQERLAQIVVEYETKVAELRVEYTMLSRTNEKLTQALEEANAPKKDASPEAD